MSKQLSEEGKQQLALALILLKDFKCEGHFDVEIYKMIIELAEHLGITKEYNDLLSKIPQTKIVPRYPNP